MTSNKYSVYETPTLLGKIKNWLAFELEYLPDTIRANPIKATLAGTAMVTGLTMAATAFHDLKVTTEVAAQLYAQRSNQATSTTFGIHRTGTIFNGVAQRKVDEDDLAGQLQNQAITRYVPADDKTIGCKVVNMVSDDKNLLRFVFGKSTTVAVFNNPAFLGGDYECMGLSTTETSKPALLI